MTDLKTFKDRVRRDARGKRKSAALSAPDADQRAAAVFLDSAELRAGDTVSLYRAIQSELNPAPLVRTLWDRSVRVCFPVVTAPDTPLEFRLAEASTRFVPGAFGAEIPEDGSPVVSPTLILAPLLAFDRELFRLGYGGGFYDRTLEMLRGKRPTRAFGYAYAAQEMDTVPIEETDQRLDGVVTEEAFIRADPE